jgi:hypothetical protein
MRHQPQKRQGGTPQNDHSPRRRSFWRRLVDEPVALFTAVLTLFTGILMLVGALQTWAFVASERAFLTVGNFTLTIAPDAPLAPVFLIKNTGKSVGSIVDFNIAFSKSLAPKPNYATPLSGMYIGPILPGVDNPQIYRPNNNAPLWKLTQTEVDEIKNGKQQLFIFGFVSYSDDFWLFGGKVTGCYLLNPSTPGLAFETCNHACPVDTQAYN